MKILSRADVMLVDAVVARLSCVKMGFGMLWSRMLLRLLVEESRRAFLRVDRDLVSICLRGLGATVNRD